LYLRSRPSVPTRRSSDLFPAEAPYAVTMAHRIRFAMTMNAREAMHLIELRSQPQGHDAYRAVALEMHRLIAEDAGHRAVAAAMRSEEHTSELQSPDHLVC